MRASTDRKRLRTGREFFIAWLIGIAACGPAFAQDSVEAVMKRMKSTSAVRIAYQQTQYLELFDKPVETSGMLYGMPPDSLLKEQLVPEREIMGILKDHNFYYDPNTGTRHSRDRNPEDPVDLHIAAFQALANGNRDVLNAVYDISFVTEPGHWYMILEDKKDSQPLIRITVSGAAGESADQFEIHEADGDRSVYRLRKYEEGEDIRAAVLRLEAELTGK